jgi:NADH dehydrogenase FAD-containing subunit
MVKNIVIVGGGFAGTQVASALEKALVKANNQAYRIILIEKVKKKKKKRHI